jgi:hypothetical protein
MVKKLLGAQNEIFKLAIILKIIDIIEKLGYELHIMLDFDALRT